MWRNGILSNHNRRIVKKKVKKERNVRKTGTGRKIKIN